MQLVGLCRQLHYRGVFIIFLIWRLFVDSTQKAVKNQEICEPLQGNLGITQSSGLDRHAVFCFMRRHFPVPLVRKHLDDHVFAP